MEKQLNNNNHIEIERNYILDFFSKAGGITLEIMGVIGISTGYHSEKPSYLIAGVASYFIGLVLNTFSDRYFSIYQSYHATANYNNIFEINRRISELEKKVLGKSFDDE